MGPDDNCLDIPKPSYGMRHREREREREEGKFHSSNKPPKVDFVQEPDLWAAVQHIGSKR